jgi:hypothetical protein
MLLATIKGPSVFNTVPDIFVPFYLNLIILTVFHKSSQCKFNENPSTENHDNSQDWTDGQMDMMRPICASGKYVNMPNMGASER